MTSKKNPKAPVEKKVNLTGAVEIVKKIPAFVKRMHSELEKLLVLIEKAEAFLATFDALKVLTKEQKTQKRLLEKQVKAMKAYRDVLEQRVSYEESKL